MFQTSQSRELALAAQAFALDRAQLAALVLQSAEHAFLPAEDKDRLQSAMRRVIAAL